MKIELKFKYIIPIGLIVFIAIIIQIQLLIRQEKTHPKLDFKLEYKGVILKSKPYQSICYIRLPNDVQLMLNSATNKNYSPFYLNQFIQIGDSIYKPMNSDTLYIFRENEEYFFVLGKIINQK